MADVKIEIDQAAIDEMSRDWSSPVGEIIRAATERVADYQRFTAPVSPKGSRYAPPGFLRSTITAAEPVHHDESGKILGLAGTHTNKHGGGYPYPLAFISNDAGRTLNPYLNRRTRRPLPGREVAAFTAFGVPVPARVTARQRTYRAAHNRFIQEALHSLASFVYYAR